VEWAWGIIPIFFDALETNTKQRFNIVDDGIDGRCRFYVLVGFHLPVLGYSHNVVYQAA
jgi:hypothetical protein